MKSWIKLVLIGALFLAVAAAYALSKIKNVAAAYLYGYPLVMMEQSRLTFLGPDNSNASLNQFRHISQFPDHTFRNVVRPNNDTLYSIAWLDLSKEPLILSVPDTKGRYYVMPFMDAWTNVFAMVGQRITGSGVGHYGVVGPQWEGELPSGVIKIDSPTNMVWLIGRIQTNGDVDIPNVAALQRKFLLTPLSQWGHTAQKPSAITRISNSSDKPMAIVDALSANSYFLALNQLMTTQASLEGDELALDNLRSLGVTKQPYKDLGPIDRVLFNRAIKITHQKLNERINTTSALENGWTVHRSIIGNYGTSYALRAGVAKVGLGALPPQEAVYPATRLDSQGMPLSGGKRYTIHFDKGQTPPVNAFWSLSLYDENGFFTDNSLKRYSIGDRDSLQFNADGSLDIFIQAAKPISGLSNWLPAPRGSFSLTMRLYSPNERFLNGDWALPKVVSQP